MIDDIVFTPNEFILELPLGTPGGVIEAYSLDGDNYDFISTSGGTSESSYTFVY